MLIALNGRNFQLLPQNPKFPCHSRSTNRQQQQINSKNTELTIIYTSQMKTTGKQIGGHPDSEI
ncbi:hypothetical protein K4039_18435 [Lyngbya sp. CCAP 1446/10]|uniref:hypothetical protein n=1 Tax=Lyngbya sp. CCAP 1446/10 TaxID=439293 RepID=UPI00223729B6|nr:hypothetical protein [Lyngbya sp. CCAP 1446/10]MCW6052015.1 hypothetical protein [Lyngbya sp. CCAP 1446/10]